MKQVTIGIHFNDVREMSNEAVSTAIHHAETMVSMMLAGYAQAYAITGLEFGGLENARIAHDFVKNTYDHNHDYEHEFFDCFKNIDFNALIHTNGTVE